MARGGWDFLVVRGLAFGALAKPALVPAGAAATAATVFIHEFEIVLAKVEVSGCVPP
jgi:hypothetical protein